MAPRQLGEPKLPTHTIGLFRRNVIKVDGVPGHGHRLETEKVPVLLRAAADLIDTDGIPTGLRAQFLVERV
jgi:hypothetical protein